MVTKIIVKLMLHPLDDYSERLLEQAKRDVDKVSRIVAEYLRRVLPARLGRNDGYPKLTRDDIRAIKEICRMAGVRLKANFIELKVLEGYNNMKTAYECFGVPARFGRFSGSIPIRISKVAESGRYYKRDLTFIYDGVGLVCEFSPFPREVGRYFLTSKMDVIAKVVRAVYRDGMTIGDPSQLVFKPNGVYLHVSATPISNRVEVLPNRVMGVDIGIAKYLSTYFIVDFANGDIKFVCSGKFSSDVIVRLARKRSLRVRKKMSEVMGRVGVKKGLRFAERTALGESKYVVSVRDEIYRIVNRIIEAAIEHRCGIIAVEKMKGFRGKLHHLKLESKRYGRMFATLMKMGRRRDAFKALREKRRIEKIIDILRIWPYRRFLEDLKTEAAWFGINVVEVKAFGTSTTCPRSGHHSKGNRPTRGLFRCEKCHFTMQADILGALNIALRAAKLKHSHTKPFLGVALGDEGSAHLGHKSRGWEGGTSRHPPHHTPKPR